MRRLRRATAAIPLTRTRRAFFLCAALCASLTACGSLLEREYVTVEPHSEKFWESEAAGTLRAENYQDIVNDLLLLIGERRETATLRLYHFDDDVSVSDRLEQATVEIQQETPLGSYAVAYITSAAQLQRGYHEVKIQIGYRRTAEELRAIVNATSPEALSPLLRDALERKSDELAVRIGYWGASGQEQVDEAKARLREELGLTDFPDWPETFRYPESGPVGLLEFRLDLPSADAANVPDAVSVPDGGAESPENGNGANSAGASDAANVPDGGAGASDAENVPENHAESPEIGADASELDGGASDNAPNPDAQAPQSPDA